MQTQGSPDYGYLYSMSPDCSASPLRRGPMYPAYAELRESNIRRKIARFSSPISVPSRVQDLTTSYRKENKKPDLSPLNLPPSGLKPKMSAPSMTPKISHKRAVSASSISQPSHYQRLDVPATPRATSSEPKKVPATKAAVTGGGGGSLTRSYSCLKEMEFEMDGASTDRSGRSCQKPTLSRLPSLRRQTSSSRMA